jgi:hypothetical protein
VAQQLEVGWTILDCASAGWALFSGGLLMAMPPNPVYFARRVLFAVREMGFLAPYGRAITRRSGLDRARQESLAGRRWL